MGLGSTRYCSAKSECGLTHRSIGERPFGVAEVLEGRTTVGRGRFYEGEKVCRERPIVTAKVVDGKRLSSIIMFRSSQRRSQFSQSAPAQSINNFVQASRQGVGRASRLTRVVAWTNVELTKNAAEIGCARFLYATRR
jgi:hypothetical protein